MTVMGDATGHFGDHDVTSPTTTVVIARRAQGGIRQDLGASLKINGVEVLDSANSGAAAQMSTALQGGVAATRRCPVPRAGTGDGFCAPRGAAALIALHV